MTKGKKQSIYIHKQAEWAELYRQGMSLRQIGEKEGVFYRTVQNVIKDVVELRPKQKYTEQAKEWVKLYEEGWSSNQIAEKYQVGQGTVTKYLKELGVEIRYQPSRERPFDHYVDEWVQLYEQGKSLRDIAQQYGVHLQSVHNYIKDKTTMREYTETSRKHAVNEHYFDEIDTPTKAYWLGMLYSSGCVIRGTAGYAIQLSTNEKDVDRLYAFKQAIGAENPIEKHVNKGAKFPHFQIRIHSKVLYESLLKLGLEGDKTDSLTFPQTIKKEYYPPFILGYYDGHGSCYAYHSKTEGRYNRVTVRMFGTSSMLKTIQELLSEEVGVVSSLTSKKVRFNRDERHPLTETYTLEIGRRQSIEKLAKWLYEGQTEFSRKRDIRAVLDKEKNQK